MPAIVITKPRKTIFDQFLNNWQSRWNSGHDPIEYTFLRQDYTVASITQNGATGKVTVTLTANVGQPFTVGGTVFISDPLYKGSWTVVTAPTPGAVTKVMLDLTYITDSFAGGYINNITGRKNYYLKIYVVLWNLYTNGYEVIQARFTPDADFLITCDIQQLVRTNMEIVNKHKYPVPSAGGVLYAYPDRQITAKFQISYGEFWFGSAEGSIQDTEFFWATKSVRQPGDRYGANLAEFVGVDFDNAIGSKAKWISDFDEPTYFLGYPFDLALIFSDLMENQTYTVEWDELNSLRQAVGHTTKTFGFQDENGTILTPFPCECRLKLDTSYPTGVDYILIWLLRGGILQIRYVDQGYYTDPFDPDNYTLVILPTPTFAQWVVTEKRVIKLEQGCVTNPVYLIWRGMNGGWNYWLFGWNQEYKHDGSTDTSYTKYVTDLQTCEGTFEVIQRTNLPSIKIGAQGINKRNYKGFESLMDSPKVQMLVSQSPLRWVNVELAPGSLVFNNQGEKFDVEFNLNLNRRKVITQ